MGRRQALAAVHAVRFATELGLESVDFCWVQQSLSLSIQFFIGVLCE